MDDMGIPSVGTFLKKAEILDGFRKAGFSATNAEIIFDVAVKAVDDAQAALDRACAVLPPGPMAVQAATVAFQFNAMFNETRLETLLSVMRNINGTILHQQPDGSVVREGPSLKPANDTTKH